MNDKLLELNEFLDDALEFGTALLDGGVRRKIKRGMRKFKRNLDIGGRGMEAAQKRVNMVPLHEYVNPGLGGPRSARARKALNMRRRARSRARGVVIGTGIGGTIGTAEALRQRRKKNER